MNNHTIRMVLILGCISTTFSNPVKTAQQLMAAVNSGEAGQVVELADGVFKIPSPLKPKSNMVIRGAGTKKTIIMPVDSWKRDTTTLNDRGGNSKYIDRTAYLIDLTNNNGITITNLTLCGNRALHGGVYGYDCDSLTLNNLYIEKFIWSSIRTFSMDHGKIHDNVFVDAGGRYKHSGGALFLNWVAHSEFWNNRITKTPEHPNGHFYGFKGRKATHCRFHHNTVLVNFSFEFPFENDAYVEVDHNYFTGVISIPKDGGGNVPEGGYTFHIHHNWLHRSYSLEWSRNGAEVNHNLFLFDTENDRGNLISSFNAAEAPGPTKFHNNLIINPGRGVFWARGPYNNYEFYNNHVIANTTITPRKEGLFGMNKTSDFSTIVVKDNIFEIHGLSRPLMRNDESRTALIQNNTLINVSDSASYDNKPTGAKRGLLEPLYFHVGAYDEYLVDGLQSGKTAVAHHDIKSPMRHFAQRSHLMGDRSFGVFTLSGRRLPTTLNGNIPGNRADGWYVIKTSSPLPGTAGKREITVYGLQRGRNSE